MQINFNESALSATARDKVRLAFNPSGDDTVTHIKMLTARLITLLEDLQGNNSTSAAGPGVGPGRVEARTAIEHVQTASMWSVLAATKGK